MYDHKLIEEKWRKKWQEDNSYKTSDKQDKPKYYILDMFPYPSGAGLHVGHPKGYIATDIFARMKILQGYNVLHPMGWDAFGLPAENFALKNKMHPRTATQQNIDTFKRQLELLGFSYDWSREINTTDPEFYKWTQWAFIKMFEKGLAYESYEPINWCPSCKTGLANEDLENGKCERCGSEIEQKPMRQWVLKITKYADRLLNDLEKLPEWEESIKEMQKNWIGRSEGATVKFPVILSPKGEESQARSDKPEILRRSAPQDDNMFLEVFTTRPDTLFGCTYMVVAPEHKLIKNYESAITNYDEIKKYIDQASKKTAMERTELAKEKTGVKIEGISAINPANNEEVPIYVADYVMMGYGTGAIMAVPAHDERDWEFAKKYNLEIKSVVAPFLERDIKTDRPTENRRVVSAIVRDPKNDNFLCMEWITTGWKSFASGGVDEGEDLVAAAKRELEEETGYKNVKFIKIISDPTFETFYRPHKDSNVFGRFDYVLFDLENDEQSEISQEEKDMHNTLWLDKDKVADFLNLPGLKFAWNNYVNGNNVFSSEGVNINSDFLNELKTNEAKEKIINWLEEKGLGKRAVNYKLKDWVFSRQRYWGEPIPIIHCKKCKNKKYKYLLIHGRHGTSKDNFFPWLKRELEERGHQVFSPDLPNTQDPKVMEQADFIINNISIDEDTIVVGHSLGGAVALKLLEKTEKKVSRVVLVDSIIRPEFNDQRREDLEKNFDWKFDFEKIKKLSGEFVDLADTDFPVVTKKQFCDKEEFLHARLIYIKTEEEHFCSKIEPSILKYALNDGVYAVPETDLPVVLPEVKHYEPTGTGESPLANIREWAETTCPKCGGPAKRETNTMPQWAGSSWYYLRYIDPHNDKALVDKEKEKYWSPVDFYVGGAEHATRHLIYARFWHKFLFDIGAVNYDEPFKRLQHVGLILAEDGRKMSKRWGNVINPDEIVEKYGADAMRVYEMFMGPFSQAVAWNTNGLIGARKFLEKVIKIGARIKNDESWEGNKDIEKLLHKTIKKVSEDIEEFKLNTAVSAMMILVNEMEKEKEISQKHYSLFLIILSPFTPHITEELWNELGNKESIFKQKWPEYNEELAKDEKIELVLQVNGKLRDSIMVSPEIEEEEAKKLAFENEKIKKWVAGKEIAKIVFVKGKLVNIVIK